MAADFNKPVTTDNYVDLLAMLRDNQAVLARMFAAGTTANNIPVGAVRFDSGKFQTWGGAAWVDVPVSLDGGGTGAQSAADARVALGTNNAANLTTGVMSADRVPGLDASKIVSGTLTRDTSGNAATATYATSAGSAGSASTAGYATSAGVSNENRASISGATITGPVTTSHSQQVNASASGRVSGYCAQVNASTSSEATGNYSQVNASYSGTASGENSQVNASDYSEAFGPYSQVNASAGSEASSNYSQVNASYRSEASIPYTQVNASHYVQNTTYASSAWGFAPSGSASTANQQIRLESATGVGRFKGNTTTGGFDYAEYFPHLTQGVIPDGTIVTLVDEKITPAQAGDFILGTVSATAGVIGNAPEFCWSGRFLKDEFGRELKQQADFVRWQSDDGFYNGLVSECDKPIPSDAEYYTQEIPITNPDYVDISSDYKPRGDRKDEWSVIGLMGQVYVRVYEDIEHNTYVGADGKQSDTETRLYCMKMTTPYSTEKGYGVAFCLLR